MEKEIEMKKKDIVYINMPSAPGTEIRIAFFICYLKSLYAIELGHYFCPEFVVWLTPENLCKKNTVMAIRCMKTEVVITNFE